MPFLTVKALGQRDGIEPYVLAALLEEPPRAQRQRLVAEHVLVPVQLPARERALTPPVELPERAVIGLDEAHVVEVDVVRRRRRRRVALAGGGVVCARERL